MTIVSRDDRTGANGVVEPGLDQVRRALADLRGATDTADLGRRATRALCRSCGFRRAMLSRIEDGHLVVWSACVPADPPFERELLAFASVTRPVLDMTLVEADAVRWRRPILVADVTAEPRVHRDFVTFLETPGYVAAPLLQEDRVIGFVHADLAGTAHPPGELDRARLGAFAEGLGHAMAHARLLDELQDARRSVRGMLGAFDDLLVRHGVGVVDGSGGEPGAAPGPAPPVARRSPSALSELTGREREVLELMADGLSNADIARRLVITPGTAKSHVSHILRKLGAGNRAEAVSQYLRG